MAQDKTATSAADDFWPNRSLSLLFNPWEGVAWSV
jgi:hypothetical protein